MFSAFGIPSRHLGHLQGVPSCSDQQRSLLTHRAPSQSSAWDMLKGRGGGRLLYNLLSPTRDVLRLRQTSLRGGLGGLGGQLLWSVSVNPCDNLHAWTWARRLANSQKRSSTARAKQWTSVTYGHLLRGWCWVEGGCYLCLVTRFMVPAHELIVQTKAGWV